MNTKLLIITLSLLSITTLSMAKDSDWLDLTPCEEIGNDNPMCQGAGNKEKLVTELKEEMGVTVEVTPEEVIVNTGKAILVPNPRYIQSEEGVEQYCIPLDTAVIGEYTWECAK